MIAEAEDENASAFTISKEDIDSVLQKGSGVADGKYRIYRQFQKGEDRQKILSSLKMSMERAAVRTSSPMVSAVILGMTAKVLPLTETALIPITTLC